MWVLLCRNDIIMTWNLCCRHGLVASTTPRDYRISKDCLMADHPPIRIISAFWRDKKEMLNVEEQEDVANKRAGFMWFPRNPN